MAKYKPGESGNKLGRPAGKTPAAALKKIIADRAPELLDALINQAIDGDTQANIALLSKVIPNLKSQNAHVTIEAGSTLAETGDNVIDGILTGKVTADTGALILTSLNNQSRVLEVTDLETRLRKLEGQSDC